MRFCRRMQKRLYNRGVSRYPDIREDHLPVIFPVFRCNGLHRLVNGLASDREAFQPIIGCVEVAFSPPVPDTCREALRFIGRTGFDPGQCPHLLSEKGTGHHGAGSVTPSKTWRTQRLLVSAHRAGNREHGGANSASHFPFPLRPLR